MRKLGFMAVNFGQANGDGASSCGSSSDQELGLEWPPSAAASASAGPRSGGILSMRGLQWRIHLGVLPQSSSIDELRRAAANGRRRYAELRRRLLVDPHISEENHRSSDLSLDNPLSQNPESVWGRFFKNAELERTIESDLSRLYPEHGSYFQRPKCQAMLRRILLLWSLKHPDYSYRQGMHELLGPLMYVLHVDVSHLLHVKNMYEDLFDDRFEDLQYQGSSVSPRQTFGRETGVSTFRKKQIKADEEVASLCSATSIESIGCESTAAKPENNNDVDEDIMSIFLGSDAYGAEGELGALLSLRFMEHDAYCMFDALLSGNGGAVAMADYFVNTPSSNSISGLPPVIEASGDIYHLLAVSDVSLYTHLVELGVEPQYFALRWLRVLFGREFSLEDLLRVWDSIFASPNTSYEPGTYSIFGNSSEHSPRSTFITAMSVSMIFHLRSALLATPNATTCLQKLLNFPRNVDVSKLVEKAKFLQDLALDVTCAMHTGTGTIHDNAIARKLNRSSSSSPSNNAQKVVSLQHQHSSPCSPDTLKHLVSESYWEQKWKHSMLQKSKNENFTQHDEEVSNSKNGHNQDHTEPNSSSLSESQDMEAGSSSPQSLLSHGGNSHRKSTRRKLLGPANKESSAMSNTKRCLFVDDNDSSPCSARKTNHRRGSSIDTAEKNSATRSRERENGKIKVHDDQIDEDDSHSIAVEKASSVGHIEYESISSSQPQQPQETGRLSADSCTITTNNSEASSFPSTDDGLDTSSQPIQEGMPPTVKNENSNSSKILDKPIVKVNAEEVRKPKFSSAAFAGKIRWFWNFGRNNTNNPEKSSSDIEKSELAKESTSDNCNSIEKRVTGEDESKMAVTSTLAVTSENGDQAACDSGSEKQTDETLLSSVHAAQNLQGDQTSTCSLDLNKEDTECTNIEISSNLQVPEALPDQSVQPIHVTDATSDDNVASNILQNHVGNTSMVSSPFSKDNVTLSNLRSLGQSMLENIQVIESAFSQGHSIFNKDQYLTSSAEKVENSSMNFLAEKGQAAAFVALTQLRKISNILSQM